MRNARVASATGTMDPTPRTAPANNPMPTNAAARPGGPAAEDHELDAWFNHEERKALDEKIIFGHWASLQGHTSHANAIGLDTGCVWGNALTIYCLETGERVEEPCGCG